MREYDSHGQTIPKPHATGGDTSKKSFANLTQTVLKLTDVTFIEVKDVVRITIQSVLNRLTVFIDRSRVCESFRPKLLAQTGQARRDRVASGPKGWIGRELLLS